MNLVRENIRNLVPYSCARDEFDGVAEVYLDANENYYDFSKEGLNRYPDPTCKRLRGKLENVLSIDKDNLVIGNGSDELIDNLLRIYCEPKEDSILIFPPTYGAYKVFADVNNVRVDEVPLQRDFSLDLEKIDDYLEKRETEKGRCKLIFVCSPNNPTGNSQPLSSLIYLLEKKDYMVVVDEAYGDFSSNPSAMSLLDKYENLVVLKTLSKCFALAGARIGIMISSKQNCQLMNKVKAPYNVGLPAQNAALKLLESKDEILLNKKEVIERREYYKKELEKVDCVLKVYDSDANFLLVKTKDSNMICSFLQKNAIIVRNRTKELYCENCIRITIGSEMECKRVLNALKEVVV